MPWVSDDEFWHKHAAWHRSAAAREIKRRLAKRQNGRCARCGLRYRAKYRPSQLQLNLTRYKTDDGKLVFDVGVRDDWCNLLCPDCHPKGTYTWQKLASDKETDVWRRAVEWLFRAAWRLVKWPFTLLWRSVKWLFRR